jgi:hypothetical protein
MRSATVCICDRAGLTQKGMTMATIADPSPVSGRFKTGSGRIAKTAERQHTHAHHVRNEIAVLAAFCAMLLFVYLTRNYAS